VVIESEVRGLLARDHRQRVTRSWTVRSAYPTNRRRVTLRTKAEIAFEVARAGIEPATFRFSGGLTAHRNPFVLVRMLWTGRIGPLRAPVLKVWPYFGPINRPTSDALKLFSESSVVWKKKGVTVSRIFLSHHHDESRQAVALKQWLAEQDPPLAHDIFLDLDRRSGIRAGRWKHELLKAKSRCEAVICMLSQKWAGSVECQLEFRNAEDMGKHIICVRLEPSNADDLTRDWQRFDLFGEGERTAIDIGDGSPVLFNSEALYRIRDGIRGTGISAESFVWPPQDDRQRAPYRGWEPIEEQDAGVFFGRDAELVLALDALREMRKKEYQTLFVVLGPSGSGKSSFMRAGLMPRLRREDRHFSPLAIMRPERRAITGKTGLANAIHEARCRLGLDSPSLGAIKSACASDPVRVRELLVELQQTAAARLPGSDADTAPPTLVLPIDQAEELFSADAGQEAAAFLGLLTAIAAPAADGKRLGLIVVVTIRTDRYELMQTSKLLAGLQTELFDDLKPMPPTQFKEVITGPATRFSHEVHQLRIDPALVNTLLDDCTGGGDTLPLLALTLARLFNDYGSEHDLTVAHYQEMGGLQNVVQAQVDEVLPVDPTERVIELELLRVAFIPWLATINRANDEPMRRVARWNQLPEASREYIDKFVAQRLLVKDERDNEVVVEAALESLLRQWGELAGWLREQRDDLKDADTLEYAAADWERNDHNDAWLLEGARLTAAERLAAKSEFRQRLAESTDHYLGACRTREDTRRGSERRRQEPEAEASVYGSDLPGIYLSHSSLDNRAANAVKSWLISQEPELADKIYLDIDIADGLQLGTRWRDSLREGLTRSEIVVCLVSEAWQQSAECRSEYRTAENLGKRILPALLEPSTGNGTAADWASVDLFGPGPMTDIPSDDGASAIRFSSEGLSRLREALIGGGVRVDVTEWPPPNDPQRAPYLGWEPFSEVDAAVFFGRDGVATRAMEILRGNRAGRNMDVFAVLGASGVGKSSFLQAGLVPRIRAEADDFVLLDVVRPRRAVLTGASGLALAIHAIRLQLGLRAPALGNIKQACVSEDVGQIRALLLELRHTAADRRHRRAVRGALPKVIVPLDQAEELFAADAGPEAMAFLRLVAELADHGDVSDEDQLSVIVIATIRTDRYELMQMAPELAFVDTVVFDDLKPMPITHLRDVIVAPAIRSTRSGHPLRVDPELVDRLLADVGAGRNPLPLLSDNLRRLYEDYGGNGTLTLDDYRNSGGIFPIAQSALDGVLSSDPEQRARELATMKAVFIPWLTTILPEEDRPTHRLARYADLPDAGRPLIDALVEKRLLLRDRRDDDVTVEVAWDGLWRQWDDLARWVVEERWDLTLTDVVARNAAAWNVHHDPAWLLVGSRLTESETLAESTMYGRWLESAREYLEASRAAEDAKAALAREHDEMAQALAAERDAKGRSWLRKR
jgi:hypothetical protein